VLLGDDQFGAEGLEVFFALLDLLLEDLVLLFG
jgi:hypothetical protein